MGGWLTEARKDRALTQLELAALLGVGVSTLKRWESGKSYPLPAQRRALAACFGVDPAVLRGKAVQV